MYTLAKFLRDHMLPRTGGWTISEFIMTGGQATADNWPPDLGQIYYALRSPELQTQEAIYRILLNCAESAAKATYTRVTPRIVTKTRPGLPNLALSQLMYRNLQRIGPPKFSEDEKGFGREMMRRHGLEPLEEPFNEELTSPEELDAWSRQYMTPGQLHRGSDDSSELGWHAPMGQLLVTGCGLRSVPAVVYPTWFSGALCGTPAVHRMGSVAGKAIALSLIELLAAPEELRQAQEEYRRRTDGTMVGPLLPRDLTPPVHLRLPEWIDNRYPGTADVRWSVPPPS